MSHEENESDTSPKKTRIYFLAFLPMIFILVLSAGCAIYAYWYGRTYVESFQFSFLIFLIWIICLIAYLSFLLTCIIYMVRRWKRVLPVTDRWGAAMLLVMGIFLFPLIAPASFYAYDAGHRHLYQSFDHPAIYRAAKQLHEDFLSSGEQYLAIDARPGNQTHPLPEPLDKMHVSDIYIIDQSVAIKMEGGGIAADGGIVVVIGDDVPPDPKYHLLRLDESLPIYYFNLESFSMANEAFKNRD